MSRLQRRGEIDVVATGETVRGNDGKEHGWAARGEQGWGDGHGLVQIAA